MVDEVSWDFHCGCRHIAAAHWYVTGHGVVVMGRCSECPLEIDFDRCKMYKADNLIHLEVKSKEKQCKP